MTAVAKVESGQTPYQLDTTQVHKAAQHLLKHIQQSQAKQSETSKDLFKASSSDPSDDPEPIWLILTTKKHIVDTKRLKPGKIPVPHALVKPDTSICLITGDPQRAYKDALADPRFPENLRARIRVLGIAKIRQRYKSFESRRQLVAEYDTFLADDRVVTLLPHLLGKAVYGSSKRPVPVDLQGTKAHPSQGQAKNNPQNQKPRAKTKTAPEQPKIANPQSIAKEIEKALRSARVNLSPSVTTAIQVGLSSFTAEQLQDNIAAVVEGMQARFVPQGWRNIRAVHVKGANTAALPVWLASALWGDEEEVVEDEEAVEMRALEKEKTMKGRGSGKKRKREKLLGNSEEGSSKEMAARREALREQKRRAREELEVEG